MIKTNDADGDFTFTGAEVATKAAANVPFQVMVLNQGSDPVTVGEIVDYIPRGEGVEEVLVCNELTARILAPGQSATCTFTLEGYSTEKGGRVINTIRVSGVVNHNGVAVSASDASTVTTAGGQVLGLVIERPPTLASTGAAILKLLWPAAILSVIGTLFMWASRTPAERLRWIVT